VRRILGGGGGKLREGADETRPEMVVGWYHSHPGFGCWLSSVDVNTQQVGGISDCVWHMVKGTDDRYCSLCIVVAW
jgi:proteasome lid subunit RPN8/RPN11